MSAITAIDDLARKATVEVARLENINAALLEAAKLLRGWMIEIRKDQPLYPEPYGIEKADEAIAQAEARP